ncbi:adenylyl-sulfate kinase [Microbacterium sp. HD4P20]|uniref:adenylyl-sulfate kinase n=1 Tax=Microbacterium sp. HD4P20 TaxID=2864874 RepID=UPI001C642482|nr:adenylyl-sulfate kinase [Microbacterium sp. HD4P20]MCP2638117.1 adenylyl-sulfate kinase [Microbacterium sp. HD4P20]
MNDGLTARPATGVRVILFDAQLRELELALAGAWGTPPAFVSPAERGARIVTSTPLNAGDDVDLVDPEGSLVARLIVEHVGSAGAGRWVAGELDARRALGHLDFADLRLTQQKSSTLDRGSCEAAVVITGDVPSRFDSRWSRLAPNATAVVLDHGDTAELVRNVEALRDMRRPVLVLPAPDLAIRGENDWALAVEEVVRRLLSPQVEVWRTRRSRGVGMVVLLTGLSGSGKSTVAKRLAERLTAQDSRKVTLLDGDEVRHVLSSGLGFSKEDREMNVRRIGWVAALVSSHDGIAICAPIAPYASMRAEMRAQASRVGDFLLVHVSTPLAVCEQRDRKGLYAKARRGEIPQFTGISDPYEEPTDADLAIDTSVVDVDDAVDRILSAVRDRSGYASPAQLEYVI